MHWCFYWTKSSGKYVQRLILVLWSLNVVFQGCRLSKDIFGYLLPLCKHNYEIIRKVFANPEQVMAKYVLNIYHLTIQEHITSKLDSKLDSLTFLRFLYDLYSRLVRLENVTFNDIETCCFSRTNQLSNNMSVFQMGNDSNYLNKLTCNIFNKHIENYIG